MNSINKINRKGHYQGSDYLGILFVFIRRSNEKYYTKMTNQ